MALLLAIVVMLMHKRRDIRDLDESVQDKACSDGSVNVTQSRRVENSSVSESVEARLDEELRLWWMEGDHESGEIDAGKDTRIIAEI